MPTILYNTNSSLISKYRRSNSSKPYKRLLSKKGHIRLNSKSIRDTCEREFDYARNSGIDNSFQSEFEKDSVEYLRDLCSSVFPNSLHQRIRSLEVLPDLQINAFFALIFQNYIKSWYGVKIPTDDSKFLTELYNVVQDLIAYMKSSKINYNDLLLDYIPYLLSSHLKALKDPSLSEDLVFEHYSKLTLYDSKRYPTLFTDIIQRKLKTRSLLQRSFLDSFLNELVFGRIIDSIMEPYYLLEGLNRICMKVKLNSSMNIKQKVVYSKSNYSSWWSVSKVKQKISQMARLVSYSTSIKSPNIDNTSVPEIPFLQRYVFSLFTDDFFKLSMRKPFLFSMCRTLQHWISKSNNLNKFMYNMFGNIIRTKITSPMTIGNFFSSLRHSMFPNDNMMGPPKEVPIGDAFLEFREECICNLWDVCKTYKLARTLAIERSDIADLVICLSKNRDCNKLLLYKIIDCVVAQLI
ncbi:hypothetical protein SMKI_04G3950 [Saccharomyces mikatae IFO 1815]|uniref:PXA domain-containing protein n=1 Tax=Saccharomyces mikatae IFO 1815 TaxID=226126 RepID=A0AA35NGW8_SACMI|nr:uncharacterized protein SMKI_04G3950 [Saccharomyces mikatae IFO 1815]CAI4038056.1 hypothetical protein SMKI_04G3950 [Saccharomyces mikatae IFO 1815]